MLRDGKRLTTVPLPSTVEYAIHPGMQAYFASMDGSGGLAPAGSGLKAEKMRGIFATGPVPTHTVMPVDRLELSNVLWGLEIVNGQDSP